MENQGDVVNFPKLSRSNYEQWRTHMVSYLQQQGLWDIVIGYNTDMHDRRAQEERTLRLLKDSIDEELLANVRDEQSPEDVWDLLWELCSCTISSCSQDIRIEKGSPIRDAESTCNPIVPKKEDSLQKNFVKIHPNYLRALSQNHVGWIFGAIAELVDNSRDARATRLDISIESLYFKRAGEKIPVLSIVDDGQGMSHLGIVRMLTIGCKQPDEEDIDRIGRFGIGFKTGAMRLGRDVVVLTQTSNSRSVALLSQSYNKDKESLETPIISYCRHGKFMEVDLNVQSEDVATNNMKSIKEFSPFSEQFIDEKFGLFGEMGTGTQIYIWNLDKWGSNYSLEVDIARTSRGASHQSQGDILICSRRIRSRLGQRSKKVPLDYSLQAYLEVIFLNPRMKIYVQGSLVKCRPLAKFLNKTVICEGHIMDRPIQLILGRSQEAWEQMNCGIFLYWHGRLIEAYKRVGCMIHNTDMGHGIIGAVDVTNIMEDGNRNVWVLNNKQGFHDCELYDALERWLGNRVDEYWDNNFNILDLRKGNPHYKPDHGWVQCENCRKWRILSTNFDVESLNPEWFCYLPPFNGRCETPEQQVNSGFYSSGSKNQTVEQSESDSQQKTLQIVDVGQNCNSASEIKHQRPNKKGFISSTKAKNNVKGDYGEDSNKRDDSPQPSFKRLRRGPSIVQKAHDDDG